jgi:tRNA(Ile)-lysidine synthase
MVMLAALYRHYKVRCLHVDHGIRPESSGDAQRVQAFCKDLGVPCRVVSIPQGKIAETAKRRGLGIEGAARVFRHSIWQQEVRRLGAARILVGHTQDDLLETALMRFLRGSGPAGLAAMPRENRRIIRPLITLSRRDVLAYAQTKNIPFIIDATNADIRYLRNRIRHKLVPCLDEHFPYWRKAVGSLAEIQRLAADFLEKEARKQVAWEADPQENALYTPEAWFFAQHPLIREEAVFQAVDRLSAAGKKRGAGFEPDRINPKDDAPPRRQSIRLFTGKPERTSLDLGAARIERQRGNVAVRAGSALRRNAFGKGFALLIKEAGVYTLKGLKIVCRSPAASGHEAGLPAGILADIQDTKEAGFFACLPVVFRHGYAKGRDRIIVEDPMGQAACIFSDKEKDMMMVLGKVCKKEMDKMNKKEKGIGENPVLSFIIVSGGIDA